MLKKLPHTYFIVFLIVVLAAALTWVLDGGEFTKDANGNVIPNSYHAVESNPQTWQVFSAFFDGFVKQAAIVCFILVVGAAFWVMNATNSVSIGIHQFLGFTKNLEKYKLFKSIGVENFIIVLVMLLFSVFGAVFGMSEETIAFIAIFVPLAITMGYDSLVGVGMCFVASGLGFAGAVLNPFTIGIAQGIAGLPPFSGLEFRLVCWLAINTLGIAYVLHYAKKLKKDPSKSLVHTSDAYWREKNSQQASSLKPIKHRSAWYVWLALSAALLGFAVQYPVSEVVVSESSSFRLPAIPILGGLFFILGYFNLKKSANAFILQLLLFTIFFLVIGVMAYHWYVMRIATLFLVLGIASGIAVGYNADKIINLLIEGAKDIMSAAVVVGLAGGIIIILENGRVIDTILNGIASSMQGFGHYPSVVMMYGIQTLINIFIPSGSAQAALTIPIMSQLADLLEISRQAIVMAFQFGDGFTNMITPTSPVLLGVISVAKIPYQTWFKWILPLIILLSILGILLLAPTVFIKMNGF